MKILHTVEFYSPSLGGAQEVVRQLSEHMVKAGHDVTVATSRLSDRKSRVINGVKIVEFDISGNAVRGIKGDAKKYQDFLINSDFDVVMNYAAQQWATDLAFEVLHKIKGRKILVPCGYSSLNHPDFKDYFARLPAILKQYDATIYMSPTYQDIVFAKKHHIGNLHVITNGADEAEFARSTNSRGFRKKFGIKYFFILTIGSHTGSKGHAEALEVFEHFPFPCTLVIVGDKVKDGCYEKCAVEVKQLNFFKRRRRKKAVLLELSREDTLNALKSADLFLFLSNREASPVVLFEAAAAGTPFVASAAGNSAEIAAWTSDGVITKTVAHPGRSDDVSVDVQATVDLLKKLWWQPWRRRRMGRLGRRAWQKHYTWGIISKKYLGVYEGADK